MIRCLKESKLVNNGNPNIKINFNEKDFLSAVKLISEDIKNKYQNQKIGLIGIARGGLPLLVAVSHQTGIREISVVQIQMTCSNNKWDYGEEHIIDGYINDSFDKFIIFEDIVSHARSVNLLIRELESKNKEVLDIYTLFINEDMLKHKYVDEHININYVNMITQEQWTNFFWEKGYEKE